MKIVMYHNPRCSKSRGTLQLLNERGIEPEIVLYLDNPPSAKTLLGIASLLGVSPRDLLRTSDENFVNDQNKLSDCNDEQLCDWISAHPSALQRPIVVRDDDRAAIGRPPENVLAILQAS